MSVSYKQISKKVGYTGYMAYPSLEEAQRLAERLRTQPTVSDFEQALKLYRFTPEATTEEQVSIIEMLQHSMSLSMDSLFVEDKKKTLAKIVAEYWGRHLPTRLNSLTNPKES